MYVTFTVSAEKEYSQQAGEIKTKIEKILRDYGLVGNTQGDNYEYGATYNGAYNKSK